MKKKKRQLIILLVVLIALIVLFFVIKRLTKRYTADPGKTAETETDYFVLNAGDYATSFEITGEKGTTSLNYINDDSKWVLKDSEDFPIANQLASDFASDLLSLNYVRCISDHKELESYGLLQPALTISITTNGGIDKTLLFSEVEGVDGTYYFKASDSDDVYLTKKNMLEYASVDKFAFAKVATVPPFESLNISSINIKQASGEEFTIIPDETSEIIDAEGAASLDENSLPGGMTSDDEGIVIESYENTQILKTEKLFYYVNSKGEDDSALKPVNDTDSKEFYENFTEFMYNSAICYQPTEEDMAEFGLDNPSTVLTVSFEAATMDYSTADKTDMEMTDFVYTLYIGKSAGEDTGLYYVYVDCTDGLNGENSGFNSDFVMLMNSSYGDYFVKLTEDGINGAISGQYEYLAENEVPRIDASAVSEIRLTKNDGTDITVYTKDGSMYYKDAADESTEHPVDSTAKTQLEEYLFNSGFLRYDAEFASNEAADAMASCGLTTPAAEITIVYNVEDEKADNKAVTITWKLDIGNCEEVQSYDDDFNVTTNTEYYVTASNTDTIYTMNKTMGDYLTSISKEILDGTEVYGNNTK